MLNLERNGSKNLARSKIATSDYSPAKVPRKRVAQGKPNDLKEGTINPSTINLPILAVNSIPSLNLGDAVSKPHLLIEGENLDALTLLGTTHLNCIDFIYIDPPYNTGNTGYTYVDKFTENGDKRGPWLEFMRQRLVLARLLMAKHGIITISIDDREFAHLKILCDSVFGESNCISTLVWHSKYTVANDARFFSRQHEYVLVYAKDKSFAKIGRLPRTEKSNAAYRNQDNDPRGPWKATPIHAKSGTDTNNYEIKLPNGRVWSPPPGRYPRYSRERLIELFEDGRLWFGKDGKASISAKTFLSEVSDITPGTILNYEQVGHTHAANEELAQLIGKGSFDNPKPIELLKTLINLCTSEKDSTILDFFAGSGTTAEATARLNLVDGGQRQAILCTSNENSICENVTLARLRAVHSGHRAIGKQAEPVPLPLRYFRIVNDKSDNTYESWVSLATGLYRAKYLGPRRGAVLLSDKHRAVALVNRPTESVLSLVREIQTRDDLPIYCKSADTAKIQSAGIKNILELK